MNKVIDYLIILQRIYNSLSKDNLNEEEKELLKNVEHEIKILLTKYNLI